MEFYSAYAQGFARVAACTIPVALADPAANVESVLSQVRECHAEGDGIVLELDVHPSLFPVTVSRPHVVLVRDPRDLERIRADIRRKRARADDGGQA